MSRINNYNFRKAKKNRVFQNVVDQIQEAILDRRLNPGDMLPPERELVDSFNISRGTLREALRVLEQKGLIEIRVGTGGGSVIRQAGVEQLTESFALLIRSSKIPLHDIGEFRLGIEGKIAWLAAKRATKKDVERLERLLKSAEKATNKGLLGWEDFLSVDQKIHKELAIISNNALYRYVGQMIHDNIRKYYDKYLHNTLNRMMENFKDLKNIIQAVKKGEPEEAARFAENHVQRFNEKMAKEEAVNTP